MQPKRHLLAGLIALTLVSTATAQQSPLQIQLPPLQQPAPAVLTLHASSRAVLLDVVVTDAHGHAVHNLKPNDFRILEDGEPQTVASLEEHHPLTAAEIAAQPAVPPLGPNTFSNRRQPAANASAATVFLLDALDSSVQAQMYAREQLLSWVNEMPPGNQVAVFQLDSSLHLIQGFTSDPAVLKAAIKERSKPQLSPIPTGIGYVGAASQMGILTNAMQSLGAYLATRPGRKSLVWFTAHIPRYAYDSGSQVGGALHDSQGFVFDYSKATDSLVLGEVSVYPIDTRGLETDPAFSAANSRPPSARSAQRFSTRQFFEHTDLDQVAEATGGKAFYNTNGIKQSVSEVVETGSSFYTLSFYPTNKNWDGKYRKLKVDTAESGLQLQYRHGYYAQKEAVPLPQPTVTQAPPTKNPPDPSGRVQLTHTAPTPDNAAFAAAMHLGAVDPAGVIFTARVDVDPRIQKLSKTEPLPRDNYFDAKYKDHPFRTFKVFYRLDPTQFQLTTLPSGIHHGEIETVTLVLDNQGMMVNSLITTVEMNLNAANYAKAKAGGIELLSQIAVPEKGSYFLRAGVHDKTTGKSGALEFSTTDVKLNPPTP
jgi:VWFA-related protein